MDLDEFVGSEVALAVGAAAALFSPRVRSLVRRGTVLGLAGLLTAGDVLASVVRGVAGGAQHTTASAATAAWGVAGTAIAALPRVTGTVTGDRDGAEKTQGTQRTREDIPGE